MQSSNGHYSMHQEVPIVFLLVLFVCPSTVCYWDEYSSQVCYDYVENSMGSCWRKDILRVKGLA